MGEQAEEKFKIWSAIPDATAGMMVTEEAAFLIGNSDNFVVASENGVSITANSVSFSCSSENVRKGGLFVDSNDIIAMIPSTMYTCFSDESVSPPLGMVVHILYDLPFFLAMCQG